MIAIDIETFDPDLQQYGDGAIRKNGAILCIGLYDGQDYVCCEPSDPRLFDWLSSKESKVFHNGVYDLSWLICGYDFIVNGVIHDTMTRTALIDEYANLDLDSCCKKFNVHGKNYEDTLAVWFDSVKKVWGLNGTVWDNLDILWADPTGHETMIKYNRQDCIATYNLWYAQEAQINKVQEAYQLECDLYPIIMEMKKNGVRIDLVQLERFTDLIKGYLREVEDRLQFGYSITKDVIASPKKLTLAMNKQGIYSPVQTPTGGQSWAADALDLIDHPIIELIQATKTYTALLNKYLEGSLKDCIYNGRIYCTFSPNKRDDGGTITGRFACKKPNMQNIPARDEKHGQKTYGQEMRTLFLADEGCMIGAFDYSAIEAVLLAHYAKGQQADWFRQQIINGADYHKIVMEMTGIPNRDIIKRMNYGFIYGMGINKLISINRRLFKKLASEADMEMKAYGKQLHSIYHTKFPVIKDTMAWAQAVTKQNGSIMSIGGRVHHKPRPVYEDGRWNDGLYRMTNYLIQGSAAEILKKGLVKGWKDGVFNVLKLHLTVHDENVPSIPYNMLGVEAALHFQHECMETAYADRLLVPLKVVGEVGPNWGWWKGDIWEDMQKGIFNRDLITGEVIC